MPRRPVCSVLALGLALVLGGCAEQGGGETGPSTASPSATPTPTRSPTVAPEPTAEPTVDAHPELGELILSTAGLGPLQVGIPPIGNPGAAMIEWAPDACAGEADPAGRWVAAGYPDDLNYMAELAAPFRVAADETAVGRIDVMGSSPATEEGIRVGSTLDDLRATYPDLQGPYAGPVSQVWWAAGPAGTLVFETQGDAGGLRPAGTPEGVILIRILGPGLDPAFATANSGDVADAC